MDGKWYKNSKYNYTYRDNWYFADAEITDKISFKVEKGDFSGEVICEHVSKGLDLTEEAMIKFANACIKLEDLSIPKLRKMK